MRNLKLKLKKFANKEKAEILQRFFKTGKGDYGEGDVFLGLTVPPSRALARESSHLDSKDIQVLLKSEIHEKRLIGLLILIEKYKTSDKDARARIFNFYLENARMNNINNWDLVDLSAPNIVGDFLLDKDRGVLYALAESDNLWEKRIAIVSCFAFIRKNDFKDTLKISEILLKDNYDLIHKAVGWMLREVGKRNVKVLEKFLKKHYDDIPRTTLRYAIERFDEKKRKKFLRGEV